MKQLKSYFQRVDQLKTQLKNMRVLSPCPEPHHPPTRNTRLSSRDKPRSSHGKPDSSLSRLYCPPNSRYRSESKPTSHSASHSSSVDNVKISYLKNLVKKPEFEANTKNKSHKIKNLITSIKSREEDRGGSKTRESKAHTVSVSKSSKSTGKLFQSIQSEGQHHKTPKIAYSYRTRQGHLVTNPKKVNQDSLLIKTKMLSGHTHLFAVADGHGLFGHLISQLIAKNLSKLIQSFLKGNLTPEQSYRLAFLKLQQMINDSSINASCSGSTLVSVIIQERELVCANVGDSRAILVRKGSRGKLYDIVELSRDHKPDVKEEKERILKMGGRIEAFKDEKGNALGPERVWLPNQRIQGLAMSRSLGDNVSKQVGVTCQPQVLSFKPTQKDEFVFIGSDGIWQFISNQQLVQKILPFYHSGQLQQACDSVLKLAYQRWTVQDDTVIDDITFILIFLHH